MNIKIFVCYHKKDKIVECPSYTPIQVGRVLANESLNMIGDDTGDNISIKNPWYCELTAQYWIWKNVKDADYVGLCHYRRYLDFMPNIINKYRDYIHSNEEYIIDHSKDLENVIEKFDVILPNKILDPIPNRTELAKSHIAKDVDMIEKIIADLHPEFIPDFNEVMKKSCSYAPCNILIARRDIYFSYTKWLFDILFELEKRMSIPMDPFQPRVMGFYSERLLNVYFHHFKHYRIGYFPLVVLNSNTNRNLLFLKCRKLIGYISYRLYRIYRGDINKL